MFTPLLLLATASANPWFYPGPGPETVEIAPDSTIDGLRVARTGALLVKATEEALEGFPIGSVTTLAGCHGGACVRYVVPSPGTDEIVLSRSLHGRAGVAWAHPDLLLWPVPLEAPDDPFYADQWHLENSGQSGWTPDVDVNAETAWAITAGGGQLIAIIDSGVEMGHPDLSVVSGWDFLDDDDDPSPDPSYDGAPHGTSCAGLAAAIGDNGIGVAGVAYEADIHAVRFLGGSTSLRDMYDVITRSVDAGASVLSNSWGFSDGCATYHYAAIDSAMEYAETEGRGGRGAAVVFAAGNSACDVSGDGLQTPPTVISVAALNGDDERESYSCFGDVVDIAAPSGGVLTTDLSDTTGYGPYEGDPAYTGSFSGTSAATPIVAGTLALMFAANERLTAAQAREILCDTAVRVDPAADWDDAGWSPYYGCGRVDAGAAVLAVANEAPTAPTPHSPRWVDHLLFTWDAATDADGDWLTYTVRWSADGGEESVVDGLTTLHLDLGGQLAAGQVVTWSVVAVDAWGEGLTSAPETFTVLEVPVDTGIEPEVEKPKEKGGCNTAVGPAWAGFLVLMSLRRVKRS